MLSQKPYTHACTHITHAYTHRLWFRLAALIPPAVFPFCFCSKTHIHSDSRNPSIGAHTYTSTHTPVGSWKGRAVTHFFSLAVCLQGVQQSHRGTNLADKQSEKHQFPSSPQRECRDQGQLTAHTQRHTYKYVRKHTQTNYHGQSDLLRHAHLDRF